MAGHSKFKNIQFRKDRQDKARSKVFSKLSRDITIAARQGLPDPAANSRLRLAIANARSESMPKDNIDRAIKKAIGGEADSYEEIRYEGFGPGGVGLVIEALTDNRNRAAANLRTLLAKNGGALAETGAVTFMFERLGQIVYPYAAASEDAVLEAAIEAGAADVESRPGEEHVILTAPEDLAQVADALEPGLGAPSSAALVWRPSTWVELAAEAEPDLRRLVEALEDDDEVQTVWTNAGLAQDEI